jgi:hypothetical protein
MTREFSKKTFKDSPYRAVGCVVDKKLGKSSTCVYNLN